MIRKKELLVKMGFQPAEMHSYFTSETQHDFFDQVTARLLAGDTNVDIVFYYTNSRTVKKLTSIQEFEKIREEIINHLKTHQHRMLLLTPQKFFVSRIRFDYDTVLDCKTVLEVAFAFRFGVLNDGVENSENEIPYQRFETRQFGKSLLLVHSQFTDDEFEKGLQQIRKLLGSTKYREKFELIEQMLAPQGIRAISFDFILRDNELYFFDWDTAYNQIEAVVNTFDPIEK
jgi:hypothetical protein